MSENLNSEAPRQSPDWVRWTMRILESYERFLEKTLLPYQDRLGQEDATRIARELFVAPFAVLAHNADDDPVFVYGNQTALGLWEVDLPTLLTMPSRLSAETGVQPERGDMLRRGLDRGFIEDYGGVRVSSTGRRFRIEGATIWSVFDESGQARIGQAATFSRWMACA